MQTSISRSIPAYIYICRLGSQTQFLFLLITCSRDSSQFYITIFYRQTWPIFFYKPTTRITFKVIPTCLICMYQTIWRHLPIDRNNRKALFQKMLTSKCHAKEVLGWRRCTPRSSSADLQWRVRSRFPSKTLHLWQLHMFVRIHCCLMIEQAAKAKKHFWQIETLHRFCFCFFMHFLPWVFLIYRLKKLK